MISETYDISDDDESFDLKSNFANEPICVTSDEDSFKNDPEISEEITRKKDKVLTKTSKNNGSSTQVITSVDCNDYIETSLELENNKNTTTKRLFPQTRGIPQSIIQEELQCSPDNELNTKIQGWEGMLGGVKVNMPFRPYQCQVALIYKVITAIKTAQNCLLESPTGTGKTLALLCGALAWQLNEQNRIGQLRAQELMTNHPELKDVEGASVYIASPKKKGDSPEKLFKKTTFGNMSIYDKPVQNIDGKAPCGNKRNKPLDDPKDNLPCDGQVTIHKKRCLDNTVGESSKCQSFENILENPNLQDENETPQKLSVPRIYYGARTHKQIEQVIKELKSTTYCGQVSMSVLSSRDYSCLREFDKNLWSSKNDMCRGCIKTKNTAGTNEAQSNCIYYDNRKALDNNKLPPAFDLEDLLTTGEEIKACPYYAAKAMAKTAHIIFCPYNYLIEPSIRSNMQIDLSNNILIIDEAHNIEDICRNAATYNFTQSQIRSALTELEKVAQFRFASKTQDVSVYVDELIKTLKNWDDWFVNQKCLLNNQPVNNDEAVHIWEMEHFVQTLENHNIGQRNYFEFKHNAEIFCRRLREDPRTLLGASQATGTLLESLDTVFGYLYRPDKKYTDDYVPALVRNVSRTEGASRSTSWRNSQFNKGIEQETFSLRLICMNPAVLFEGLKSARCIILASGTLSPLISLHSELETEFKLKISPNHVIDKNRVWIGTLTTQPGGRPLVCTSKETKDVSTQDALGETVLWACQITPNGVLCFVPSYLLMDTLIERWRVTGVWKKLHDLKHVFRENKNVRDHNDIMEDYYQYVSSEKGALLFAVYRGKVSEGMDFKDKQARLVITVGVPFPNIYDMAVKKKMGYNNKYKQAKNLLSGDEWLKVQAYRALNQAVGRCVRHANDWGAVLLVDARFKETRYTEHLSNWVKGFLNENHYTFETLVNGTSNSLEDFMQEMTLKEDNLDS